MTCDLLSGEYHYIMSTAIVVPSSPDITDNQLEAYGKYMKQQVIGF